MRVQKQSEHEGLLPFLDSSVKHRGTNMDAAIYVDTVDFLRSASILSESALAAVRWHGQRSGLVGVFGWNS